MIYNDKIYEESYTFEKFLKDVKRGDNRTFDALFEIYHQPKDFTMSEIADLYDDWEFHLMYGHPAQFNYKKGIEQNEKSNIDLTKWVVLKIDLKRAREQYRFFQDPGYVIPGVACFTYETIHPRCISLLEEIDIK